MFRVIFTVYFVVGTVLAVYMAEVLMFKNCHVFYMLNNFLIFFLILFRKESERAAVHILLMKK